MKESDNFFENVYKNADRQNLESIPWASLSANRHLLRYLNSKEDSSFGRALVIGCGLGDDADALAQMGYEVDAIDISSSAIALAKERFMHSGINFSVADIFKLPKQMFGRYDLVFESRTIQSLSPSFREALTDIISRLVISGGELLLHANVQDDHHNFGGPPWPLYKKELWAFEGYGFVKITDTIEPTSSSVAPYDAVVHYKKELSDG